MQIFLRCLAGGSLIFVFFVSCKSILDALRMGRILKKKLKGGN